MGAARKQGLQRLAVALTLAVVFGPSQVGWSQNQPLPPRLTEDSLRVVSADERVVEIDMIVPRRDANRQVVRAGVRIDFHFYLSRDQSQSYEEELPNQGDRYVILPPRGIVTAKARLMIPADAWKEGGVFLAATSTVDSVESKPSHLYLSFLSEKPFTVYQRPADLRDELLSRRPQESRIVNDLYKYSEPQQAFIDQFGEPDIFEIAFVDKNEEGAQSRLERWMYLEARAAVTFSDGELANYEEFEGAPAIKTSPLYKPSHIAAALDSDALTKMVPSQRTWEIDTNELGFESKLFEDVSYRLGKGLIVGYKGKSLRYVRSLPNWPADGSTPDAVQPDAVRPASPGEQDAAPTSLDELQISKRRRVV